VKGSNPAHIELDANIDRHDCRNAAAGFTTYVASPLDRAEVGRRPRANVAAIAQVFVLPRRCLLAPLSGMAFADASPVLSSPGEIHGG